MRLKREQDMDYLSGLPAIFLQKTAGETAIRLKEKDPPECHPAFITREIGPLSHDIHLRPTSFSYPLPALSASGST